MRKSLDLVGFDFEEVSCDDIMVSVILLLAVSLLVWMGMRKLRRESLVKCISPRKTKTPSPFQFTFCEPMQNGDRQLKMLPIKLCFQFHRFL